MFLYVGEELTIIPENIEEKSEIGDTEVAKVEV
jgi:hypothetical protein